MDEPAVATAPTPPSIRPERVRPITVGVLAAAIGATVEGTGDAQVTGATVSSATARPGDLFVGMPGQHQHGAQFAAEAAASGAAALLSDAAGVDLAAKVLAAAGAAPLPAIVVESPRPALGAVAARIYDFTRDEPQLFGVTGTNGKTSTVHLLEGIARALGETTGLSSTAERHIAGRVVVSGLTTPEASDMHALIATMREARVTAAAIEVSAQALERHRVDGLWFGTVGFTNLSHDHLDDYGDLERYFAEKLKLFTPERAGRAVVSLDTPYGARVVRHSGIPVETITSHADVAADWRVRTLDVARAGTRLEVTAPDGRSLRAFIPIIGEHHAANAGLAIAMLVTAGRDFDTIRQVLADDAAVPPMPGRTENVSGPGAPAVYVDFGHSPDAFAKTLDAVRAVTTGRVIMVFGADGDRDALKRPDMAREAVTRSDVLVVTDHHPRFEDAASIRRTLVAAARAARPDGEIHEVSPPPAAIRVAVGLAGPEDSILWAGPGHQDYREIRGVKTAYSAREEARQALEEHGWSALR